MNTSSTPGNATAAIYLVLIQVVSRGLTFAANQALLRYVSPAHLGLAVQLETLSISILYTARESLRVALLRTPTTTKEASEDERGRALQGAINAAYLVLLLGLLIGSLISAIYLYPASSEIVEAANFKIAFWLYAIATGLELLSEPAFVVIQQNALFKERARAETVSAVVRCISAVATVVLMNTQGMVMSVLPFAVGQLGYGVTLFLSYYTSVRQARLPQNISLMPQRLQGPEVVASLVPAQLFHLASAFYGQSIFKWLLTQGDTFFLSYFADLQSQGIFALASNYGGLASRLLFQPIEESSRNSFGRMLASDGPSAEKGKELTNTPQPSKKRQDALALLAKSIRGYILVVAMPCITLLPEVFPMLVQLLLGARSQFNSSRTSDLLAAYSYYIPFLAINGILDAFVTSVATEAELFEQSIAMAGVTLLYLSAAAGLVNQLGLAEVGLVYANIMNMTLRIAFSLWFIRAWTRQNVREAGTQAFKSFCAHSVPSTSCFVSFALVLLGLRAKNYARAALDGFTNSDLAADVTLGHVKINMFELSYLASAGVVLISSVVLTEREFLLREIVPLLPSRVRTLLPGSQQSKKA